MSYLLFSIYLLFGSYLQISVQIVNSHDKKMY